MIDFLKKQKVKRERRTVWMRLRWPKAPLDLQRLAWLAPPSNQIPSLFQTKSCAAERGALHVSMIPPPSPGILYTTQRDEHVKPHRGLRSLAAVISLRRIQKLIQDSSQSLRFSGKIPSGKFRSIVFAPHWRNPQFSPSSRNWAMFDSYANKNGAFSEGTLGEK